MNDFQVEVTYFKEGGPENTDSALKVAKKYATEFSVNDIIIASTTGMTAQKAINYFSPADFNIIIMTQSYYFGGTHKRQEFPETLMNELREKGLKVFSTTHALAAVSRSFRLSLNQLTFKIRKSGYPWFLKLKVIKYRFLRNIFLFSF
ncbi:MAG: hypothetical protein P8Y23_06490 [Candidatus Lokiarchaeota archaeon]